MFAEGRPDQMRQHLVAICSSVPEDVKEQQRLAQIAANEKAARKVQKTDASQTPLGQQLAQAVHMSAMSASFQDQLNGELDCAFFWQVTDLIQIVCSA